MQLCKEFINCTAIQFVKDDFIWGARYSNESLIYIFFLKKPQLQPIN